MSISACKAHPVPPTTFNPNSAAWDPSLNGADTANGLYKVWDGVTGSGNGPWHTLTHGDLGINGSVLNPGDTVYVESGGYRPREHP